MKVATALISFIGCIGWGLFIIVMLFKVDSIDLEEIITPYAVSLIPIISTILYIIKTKFGQKDRSELNKIAHENEILEMKIQQKELKKNLEQK